jgi:hypothetical protein
MEYRIMNIEKKSRNKMMGSRQDKNLVAMEHQKTYTLIGAFRRPYLIPGTYGMHRESKVNGRMDFPAAIRAVNMGKIEFFY